MKRRRRVREEVYDDGGDDPYVPSDSEDEYSDSEKILLEKARKGKNAALEESEEEVFGLGEEDSSNDGEEGKMSDSDIEGKEDEDNDLPDVRAWGKKRKNFYSTDYVDQDYGGYDEKDMAAAEREEEEARAIQKRLVEQLDDADFALDMFSEKVVEKEAKVQEMIKTDLTNMSNRQKLALMQKESPEFFGLVDDFKKSMVELQDKLEPMMKLMKEGKIPASPADDYVRTKYHLLLNYCINITFYLLLKAKCIAVQSHPVVRRLYQFRQLLKQLEPVDQVVLPQIEVVLEEQRGEQDDNKTRKSKKKKKKMLKLLSQLEDDKLEDEDPTIDINSLVKAETDDEDNQEENMEEKQGVAEEEEERKRGITYQIAKNKGLTPRRKKENRNPRVKHRNKFRKAKIRRKGQVREPRKEMQKYGGEISGIKTGVVKSTKLK